MIRLDMLGALALRGTDGGELRPLLAQPKRLALLGYLAVESSHGFQRRDRLLALFWPELGQAQARQALRQSLYFLRRWLGDGVIVNRGSEEIGIDTAALRCDVCAFSDLLDQGRLEEALALYRGELLAGVFVADASPEFEQWLDAARARLRDQSLDAARKLSASCERRGRVSEAVHWSRYAARLVPDDERTLQRLMMLLDGQGDRAGALRAYTEFAQRMEAEFGVEPSAETRAVAETIRKRDAAPPSRTDTGTDLAAGPGSGAAAPVPSPLEPVGRARPRRLEAHRLWSLGAGLGALLLVGSLVSLRLRPVHERPPTLAVGWVQDPSGADTSTNVRTFADLLATDLGRVPGLRVVSHARLYDVMGQLGARNPTPQAMAEAARRSGATQLVEGVLARAPNGTLRLDLRRVNLATGATARADSFDAHTLFELADRATQQEAAEFELRAPPRPLSDVTTTSLAARRLYEEGLRAYYQRDPVTSARLFHAALDEDSTFAMAAYYAARAEKDVDGLAARRDLELACRLVDRVSNRERLIIRQAWAEATNAPEQLALAESLVTRYPDEPGAYLALGKVRAWEGDFLGSLPPLWQAVHLDSLSLDGKGPSCSACDALGTIITSYFDADSLDAAERVAHRWTRLQPRSTDPWWWLASVYGREDRIDSALDAERMAEHFATDAYDYVLPRVVIALRAGQFAAADALLGQLAQTGNRDKRIDAFWWMVISLRAQGRLDEALSMAQRLVQANAGELVPFGSPGPQDKVAVAQVMFEMGRYREAWAVFDSLAHQGWGPPADFARAAPGLVARDQVWMGTHEATVLAAAGDTAALGPLADSLRAWGLRSAYVRDRVLFHYVRGLLLAARGQLTAAEWEYRQALTAPMEGYNRVNLELAKVLLAEGRPRDALPLLRAALRGPIEATAYYLPYTELRAELGEAFDSAGEPDSAVTEYRRVLAAWRGADAEFRSRVAAIGARVDALRGTRGVERD